MNTAPHRPNTPLDLLAADDRDGIDSLIGLALNGEMGWSTVIHTAREVVADDVASTAITQDQADRIIEYVRGF